MITTKPASALVFGTNDNNDSTPWQPLAHLQPGEAGVIAGYQDEVGDDARLAELGLISGAGVRMVKYAPFGDPVQLSVRGFHLTISKKTAQGIFVKPATCK